MKLRLHATPDEVMRAVQALEEFGRERGVAEQYFAKSIELARAGGWRSLAALALHHWGRCLAEQERFADAESRISEALAIRVELNEPRQESSRRAREDVAGGSVSETPRLSGASALVWLTSAALMAAHPLSSGQSTAWSVVAPVFSAYTATQASARSPMPRRGVLRMRRRLTASPGLSSTRRYATISRISLRS